jgi:hypothetical protein
LLRVVFVTKWLQYPVWIICGLVFRSWKTSPGSIATGGIVQGRSKRPIAHHRLGTGDRTGGRRKRPRSENPVEAGESPVAQA